MTDPTLAALLKDPTPVGRLVAADRAQELGDELLEAWLRVAALPATIPDEGLRAQVTAAGRRWKVRMGGTGQWEHQTISAERWAGPRGRVVYQWGPKSGWTCWSDLYPRGLPPPGLDAAVLAVLRRRLGECRD